LCESSSPPCTTNASADRSACSTGVQAIEPPRTAASDEFFSNWYEITEIIALGFGAKKKIQFKGVFHNQPYGMQSHIYAPLNTDMRQTYKIGGNQPGEPPEQKELGVDTPASGLYLREDVNIKVNTPLMGGMVEKEMKQSSKVMIDRITRKAELLDEGKLHAMFEKGQLKTSRPSGDPTFVERPLPSPNSIPGSPPPQGHSPQTFEDSQFKSPNVDSKGYGKYYDVAPDRCASVRASQYTPSYQQPNYQGPDYARPGVEMPGQYGQQTFVSELPGSYYQPQQSNGDNLRPAPLRPNSQSQPQVFRAEMMGDTNFLQPPPASSQHPHDRKATPPNQTQHPAYQHPPPQQSPRQSPRLPQDLNNLPSRQASNGSYQIANPDQGVPSRRASNSSYQVTNPDPPRPTSQQRHSSSNNNVEQWQRSVQSDTPIDGDYYRNSRSSHAGSHPPQQQQQQQQVEPDHLRFSNLSVQQNANELPLCRSAKCPVCGLFEVCCHRFLEKV